MDRACPRAQGERMVDASDSGTKQDEDAHDPAENESRPTSDGPRSTVHAHERRSTTHAHAHAHANAHEAVGPAAVLPILSPFPHEKLDAYRVALEMAGLSKELADKIPRGHRSVADHLLRAASNTVLLLAEGANRRGAALKRQRFVESRGECAEVAAAVDLVLVLDIGSKMSKTRAQETKHLAGRVSAMLSRLIARFE